MKLMLGWCLSFLSLTATVQVSWGSENEGENWAVLLAGSNGWSNYRHQAGVCHAYQVLHENGIPDDHIVVMMYDDLADNRNNPTPGIVINFPNGPDVYKGVLKDYTGDDVTPENLFKVLRGDAEGLVGIGSGKVINSGPNDRVFINMVDHGGRYIFGFPNDILDAEDLRDVIVEMHKNNKYKEMMIYLEACEGGSMFDDLYPDDINLYATTSANPYESSYACYWDDDRDTYIGDTYGVCWMENSDSSELTQLTIGEQYKAVKSCTSTSHVPWYGDKSIQDEFVSAFMGSGTGTPHRLFTGKHSRQPAADAVRSEDVPIMTLKKRLESAKDVKEKNYLTQQLFKLYRNRQFVTETMKKIVMEVTADAEKADQFMQESNRKLTKSACYKEAVHAFHQNCFNLGKNPYGFQMLPTLLNLCENGYNVNEIVTGTKSVCATIDNVTGIN